MSAVERAASPAGLPLPASPSQSQFSEKGPTPPAKDTPKLGQHPLRHSSLAHHEATEPESPIPNGPPQDVERGTLASPFSPTSTNPGQHAESHASLAWNASHPCYPHPNPHVPLSSTLYRTTRVIRVPRDWMMSGDLAPAFSNTYPEILTPWIREADFRRLIETLNDQLALTFSPSGTRAWVDAFLGLVTGWLWEDIGASKSKAGVRKLDSIVEDWNEQRRRENLQSRMGIGQDDEAEVVRCVELRRTGFMSLDFVIPDPHVAIVGDGDERSVYFGTRPGTRPTTRPATRPGSAGGGASASPAIPRATPTSPGDHTYESGPN